MQAKSRKTELLADETLEDPITTLDIIHDDLVADLIIRILSAPVVEDPQWNPKEAPKKADPGVFIPIEVGPEEVITVCKMAEKSFLLQDVLIEIDKFGLPMHVIADLHGQLPHLLRIFRTCGPPQRETYLFLGDYVDRGIQGMDLMLLLFCLKLRYPSQVYLLRGNHEDVNTTLNYGFFEECVTRWKSMKNSEAVGDKVYRSFLAAFNCMPMAAVVGGKIFCCHGGISPFMNSIDDINKLPRPSIVPAFGLGCDLVWADPSPDHQAWTLSHRGISFLFGTKQTEQFCEKNGLDLILRGHQISTEMYRSGYKLFGTRLVTFFSSPNYMNYKNNACVIRVDENLKLHIILYRVRVFEVKKAQKKTRVERKTRRKKCEITATPPEPKSLESEIDTEVDMLSKEMIPLELPDNLAKCGRSPVNSVSPVEKSAYGAVPKPAVGGGPNPKSPSTPVKPPSKTCEPSSTAPEDKKKAKKKKSKSAGKSKEPISTD